MIGIAVTCCHSRFGDDCPMFYEDDEINADRCLHPAAPGLYDQGCMSESAGGKIAPDWCPLRDNDFTISLV